MVGIRDLSPNTADWHVAQTGMLTTQLQLLEFNARLGIAKTIGAQIPDLRAVSPGEWVAETPVTNYDSLRTVLTRFSELVPERRLDVPALVELRDDLAPIRK